MAQKLSTVQRPIAVIIEEAENVEGLFHADPNPHLPNELNEFLGSFTRFWIDVIDGFAIVSLCLLECMLVWTIPTC